MNPTVTDVTPRAQRDNEQHTIKILIRRKGGPGKPSHWEESAVLPSPEHERHRLTPVECREAGNCINVRPKEIPPLESIAVVQRADNGSCLYPVSREVALRLESNR